MPEDLALDGQRVAGNRAVLPDVAHFQRGHDQHGIGQGGRQGEGDDPGEAGDEVD